MNSRMADRGEDPYQRNFPYFYTEEVVAGKIQRLGLQLQIPYDMEYKYPCKLSATVGTE